MKQQTEALYCDEPNSEGLLSLLVIKQEQYKFSFAKNSRNM